MAEEIRTAEDALKIWRSGKKYLGDDGGPDEDELYADADEVARLASLQGIPLEQLVPDEEERNELLHHIKAHQEVGEADKRHGEMMDPPPEEVDDLEEDRFGA
jgi:hypothetical protein